MSESVSINYTHSLHSTVSQKDSICAWTCLFIEHYLYQQIHSGMSIKSEKFLMHLKNIVLQA
jgi:hypothetical protein